MGLNTLKIKVKTSNGEFVGAHTFDVTFIAKCDVTIFETENLSEDTWLPDFNPIIYLLQKDNDTGLYEN